MSLPADSTAPSGEAAPRNASQAPGFAALAKRMSSWTSSLLTLGIVLVAGLAIGWQVVAWLQEEPAPPALVLTEPETPREVRLLSHGGPLSIDRVPGELIAARQAMRRRCREVAEAAKPQGKPGPGEERFLARLANESPREQSGVLALYEPAGEPIMTVVIDQGCQRIVAWSFAFPAGEAGWSCYTFSPAAAGAAPPAAHDFPGATP